MLKSEKDYLHFLLDSDLDRETLIKQIRGFIETRCYDSMNIERRRGRPLKPRKAE